MLLERSIEQNSIVNIFIASIKLNPNQPRKEIQPEALNELSRSISQYGLMQPIVVRKINAGNFELIAGERRLRACEGIGMIEIPAVVMYANSTDSAILALIENIQRENLNFIEEAEAFTTLISEHGLTQEELADKLGKKQSTIANKIRILKLSSEIREMIKQNSLTERHARALLKLPDEKSRIKALKIIISRGLNVMKSEELIDNIIEQIQNPKIRIEDRSIRIFKDIRIFSNTIRQAVDMMKQAGIAAESIKNENENYIEFNIKIPKKIC